MSDEIQHITTHVDDAVNRLMEQYKDKPKVVSLLSDLVAQIQDIEDALFEMHNGQFLFDGTTYPSVGAQLDGWGEVVGQPRLGLDDPTYLIFILAKIASDNCDGTIQGVKNVAAALYQAQGSGVREIYPAGLELEVGNPQAPLSLYNIILGLVKNCVPAGVSVTIVIDAGPEAFRFGGVIAGNPHPATLGFSSVADPTNGGRFSGIIFIS